MDLVVTSSRRPGAGETVLGESFKTVPGGKGPIRRLLLQDWVVR